MKKIALIFMATLVMAMGSVAVAQDNFTASANKSDRTVQSESALPFMVDIEKTPGWMIYLEGGYQWNFFRGAGITYNGVKLVDRNYTKGGVAGAIALGYNFCPKFPLTVGVKFGMGRKNKLTGDWADLAGNSGHYYQRIGLYNLDFALDYDFKNSSKITPFVGLNGGLSLISQKGNVSATAFGTDYEGKYGSSRRLNFMGGARAGLKYDVNCKVALTLFGQYSYLGSIKGKTFDINEVGGGPGSLQVSTNKIKAHMVEAKLGIRIAF